MPLTTPGEKIISWGPKNFSQGLSPLQQQGNSFGGFFATAAGIDIFRYPGFITPGPAPVLFTNNGVLLNPITRFSINPDATGKFYAEDGTKFYEIITTTLTNNVTFPASAVGGESLIAYISGADNGIFYFSAQDIGYYDLGSTFDDDYGSTTPAGAGTLNSGPHKAVIFQQKLYFTNGNFVGYLDGQTGTHGTLAAEALTLPYGLSATDMQIVNGNLDIYCNYQNLQTGQAAIVTWDGVGPNPLVITPIEDGTIWSGTLLDGFPHILTGGRNASTSVRKQNYWGYPTVQSVFNPLAQIAPYYYLTDTLNSQVVFASNSVDNKVYTYGTPYAQYSYRGTDDSGNFPDVLQTPFLASGNSIYALKGTNDTNTGGPRLWVSSKNGSYNYLEYFDVMNFSSFNNANASFQTNFVELPYNSSITFLRIYTSGAGASANFTPIIYTDHNAAAAYTGADMTSATLDANGNCKTYYGPGIICNSIAIGGNWANSAVSTATIPITRIEVGYVPH